MTKEALNKDQLMEGMVNFLKMGLVNRFVLSGPRDQVPTNFEAIVGLYPGGSLSGDQPQVVIATTAAEHVQRAAEYRSRISELKIPQRIKNLEIPDIFFARQTLERRSARNAMPYIMVLFGHTVSNGEEVVLLTSIIGISPESALKELQEKSKERFFTFSQIFSTHGM